MAPRTWQPPTWEVGSAGGGGGVGGAAAGGCGRGQARAPRPAHGRLCMLPPRPRAVIRAAADVRQEAEGGGPLADLSRSGGGAGGGAAAAGEGALGRLSAGIKEAAHAAKEEAKVGWVDAGGWEGELVGTCSPMLRCLIPGGPSSPSPQPPDPRPRPRAGGGARAGRAQGRSRGRGALVSGQAPACESPAPPHHPRGARQPPPAQPRTAPAAARQRWLRRPGGAASTLPEYVSHTACSELSTEQRTQCAAR